MSITFSTLNSEIRRSYQVEKLTSACGERRGEQRRGAERYDNARDESWGAGGSGEEQLSVVVEVMLWILQHSKGKYELHTCTNNYPVHNATLLPPICLPLKINKYANISNGFMPTTFCFYPSRGTIYWYKYITTGHIFLSTSPSSRNWANRTHAAVFMKKRSFRNKWFLDYELLFFFHSCIIKQNLKLEVTCSNWSA